MTATTERCPGCHGSGIEMSGVTYAGMSEYVGCHDCGPGCPSDCGCRVDAEPERPEFAVRAALGATQSQDGSPSATERLRGSEGAVSDAEAERVWIACGRGICAAESGHEGTCDEASGWADVSPARDAVTLDYDEASRVPALLADKAALMGERDRLRAERDRARGTAATLEAENARLRAGIEALATEMQSDSCPACHAYYADEGSTTWGCDHTEGMQHAGDMLRALLAEGGE